VSTFFVRVLEWLCTRVLDAQEKLGGDGLEPFFGLLDGGRDGNLFREMEDYFYYAQIRRFTVCYRFVFYGLCSIFLLIFCFL